MGLVCKNIQVSGDFCLEQIVFFSESWATVNTHLSMYLFAKFELFWWKKLSLGYISYAIKKVKK